MKPFDEYGVFRPTTDGGDGFRRLAIRSAGMTVFSQSAGFAIQRCDLTADDHVDIRKRFDPIDQITGHGVAKRPARDHSDAFGAARKKDGRLSCRVSAANQRHPMSCGKVRFER